MLMSRQKTNGKKIYKYTTITNTSALTCLGGCLLDTACSDTSIE